MSRADWFKDQLKRIYDQDMTERRAERLVNPPDTESEPENQGPAECEICGAPYDSERATYMCEHYADAEGEGSERVAIIDWLASIDVPPRTALIDRLTSATCWNCGEPNPCANPWEGEGSERWTLYVCDRHGPTTGSIGCQCQVDGPPLRTVEVVPASALTEAEQRAEAANREYNRLMREAQAKLTAAKERAEEYKNGQQLAAEIAQNEVREAEQRAERAEDRNARWNANWQIEWERAERAEARVRELEAVLAEVGHRIAKFAEFWLDEYHDERNDPDVAKFRALLPPKGQPNE